MDVDQILYMHWYWHVVDLDDWTIFFVPYQQSYDPCWNFVYAQYLVNQLTDFDKILFMHWYIWSFLWLIHNIFSYFSTELWPLIDFRIMFMLKILWNNWWIWSHWYFYAKSCATTKISTVAGYHVVLATLLYYFILKKSTELWGKKS